MKLIEAQIKVGKLGFDFAGEENMQPYDLPVDNFIVFPSDWKDFQAFEKTENFGKNKKGLYEAYKGDWTLLIIFKNKENHTFPCSYEMFIKANEIDISKYS